MVRLFGNVMSGEFVIALVVGLAGLFVPIPFMVLEILLGLVQAYIFTVLATVFIGAAIGGVAGDESGPKPASEDSNQVAPTPTPS
jgi:F-type H+-transporting ATPase subunit a